MARMEIRDNTLTPPAWAGDYMSRDHLIPGGAQLEASEFNDAQAVVVTVDSAGASAEATEIPVLELTGPIPAGTTLHFGEDKYATLDEDAAAGDEDISVLEIPTALTDGDQAVYAPAGTVKRILSGTVIGRTIAERNAGTGFGPASDTDDEIFIVAWDVTDASINPEVELYRPGSVVKENFLPEVLAGTLDSDVLDEVRDRYVVTVGAA
jgi:hypothetical protein